MDKRKALKLHDEDEVAVRDGKQWLPAQICGSPRLSEDKSFVVLPVVLGDNGLRYVTNREVR